MHGYITISHLSDTLYVVTSFYASVYSKFNDLLLVTVVLLSTDAII